MPFLLGILELNVSVTPPSTLNDEVEAEVRYLYIPIHPQIYPTILHVLCSFTLIAK